MAEQQAVLDLQGRLARRLRAAQTGRMAAVWLATRAGALRLLIPLSHAGEVFAGFEIQPVPHAADWFVGVANLRGVVSGVIDVARLLGAAADTGGRRASRSLVSFNPRLGVPAALLVDEVVGTRTTSTFVLSDPPHADGPPWFGHSYLNRDGETWQEINLQVLSQQDAFLKIRADS